VLTRNGAVRFLQEQTTPQGKVEIIDLQSAPVMQIVLSHDFGDSLVIDEMASCPELQSDAP